MYIDKNGKGGSSTKNRKDGVDLNYMHNSISFEATSADRRIQRAFVMLQAEFLCKYV